MAERNKDIRWSDGDYSIREAVTKLGTPCMVKVVGGCDDPAFTKGNYLKLDFGINIRKIGAKFVVNGSPQKDEILIPLGYRGKVSEVQTNVGTKIFNSVPELIKECPRYVLTEETVMASGLSKHSTIKIESKQKIELLNVSGSELCCSWNGQDIRLTSSTKIKCSLLKDDSEYTLKEVIDRYPLPQTIKCKDPNFLNVAKLGLGLNNNFEDEMSETLELTRITNHEVIVGVLKAPVSCGPNAGMSTLKKSKQTICIFVLTSASVNEIQVRIPEDKKCSLYRSYLTRMFPAEVDRALINESLFIDLASNINVQVLKDKGWTAIKVEKPKSLSKQLFSQSPTHKMLKQTETKETKGQVERIHEIKAKVGSDDKQESMTSKASPIIAERSVSIPKQICSEIPQDMQPDNYLPIISAAAVNDARKCSESPLQEGEITPTTPSPIPSDDEAKSSLKMKCDLPPPIPTRERPRGPQRKVFKNNAKANDDYEEPVSFQDSIYHQIGYVPKEVELPNPKDEKSYKKSGIFSFWSKDKDRKDKKNKNTQKEKKACLSDKTGEAINKDDKKFKMKSRPVASVPPSTQAVNPCIKTQKTEMALIESPSEFAKLSVAELCTRLQDLGLHDLATLCEKAILDGKFFMDISEDELMSPPFSLNTLDMMKFKKFRNEMWVPKV